MYNAITHVEKAERAGAKLLANAVVYRLEVDATGRVGAMHYKDLNGDTHRVKPMRRGRWRRRSSTSLRFLSQGALQAIVTYVRSVLPVGFADDRKPRFDWENPAADDFLLLGTTGISDSNRAINGAELYSGNRASCHGADGKGSGHGYYPPMLHDTTVGAPSPNNLIMVLMTGVHRQGQHDMFSCRVSMRSGTTRDPHSQGHQRLS